MTPVKILGISGSLRAASHNTGLLRAAAKLLPANTTLTIADISTLPLYNQDLLNDGLPEPVRLFREQISQADALLIATPEYNYSITGALKNAIDWASRPMPETPLAQKPLAIMGASAGQFGTVRAQMQLRQMAVITDMLTLNKPEVLVTHASSKFDSNGDLIDEPTRDVVRAQLAALATWTRRLRGE